MTLEELLDEAARGNLRGLSLWPHRDGKQWQASVARENDAWCLRFASTPSEALLAALRGSAETKIVHEAQPADDEDIFG